MLPDNLKTSNLKCHYWLDKSLAWCYIRYSKIDKLKSEEYWRLIYHINCSNIIGAERSRLYDSPTSGIICTGCHDIAPEEVVKQAKAVWLMEKTQYGG